ncbi:MAG: YicC/YloC family endoribonuclease [Tenuifilaceae bacterium]|jgi:uncharacterized protein (TIGR00255 family)|nr:YicC family protein [Bacteroidales bacterium]MDI9516381.1 YicC/YloC family endoribonuclease [Bacteroidota bacterium]OQC62895.1 MAG: hypothetical protein BWX49_01483 [Bacteroidetes bacterium ADurb.Bin008]HNV82221.1 YicC family protein [Tenuifilaceae bacterium]HOF91991.1 YicC family protein [Tenuifilaceae bacterium]
MLKSMTGFGKAEVKFGNRKIITEVRSLNSKQLDISNLKIPLLYREKELDIRNLIAQSLQRGKVDIYITTEEDEVTTLPTINSKVFKAYLKQFEAIANELGISLEYESLFQTILKLPEVFNSEKEDVSPQEWEALINCVSLALDNLNDFRYQEGKATEKDLILKVKQIKELLYQLATFEGERIEEVKGRLLSSLAKLGSDVTVDENRFEQELIFYLEKLDINEEKVRLDNHCKYFLDTLNEEEQIGKKLSFIAQEMGREINTLGSKANHAEIQKIVVLMKDELEKIKEQLQNVL